ncbi:nuclear receptor 2C2-associated protein isoform X1 [Grammomys surdaster]|uniref:nuclear receptor 2C2-associated protein isoform X1 n=1 Tax=Grammomys surdaster TaxID=491861 RepID=UPI0010A0A929|nr:nuclear receptor 2C2-associated protein isoform X1 [Grammomys surdaster]
MTQSLVCPETVSRVSSVLNRNSRQFGKKHLFDQDEETCWNSDQGPSQWVSLEFPQCVQITQLQVQFQGGFSSRHSRLEGSRGGEALSKIVDFYPEDTNALQISCLSCGGRDLVFHKLRIFGCGGTGTGEAGTEGSRMPIQAGHVTRPGLKRVTAVASYT